MLQEQGAEPSAPVAAQPACGPRWRALLEDRWQARLRDVTELSLAYCRAADVIMDGQDAYGLTCMTGCGIADVETHESMDPVLWLWRSLSCR